MSYITHEMVPITDYNDFYAKIKTYFQEAGWTLEKDNFDGSTQSTQNFVVSSDGEAGTGPTQYLRIYYYSNTTYLKVQCSAYYNSGTDTMYVKSRDQLYSSYLVDGAMTLWFYGDKDNISIIIKNGSTYREFYILSHYEMLVGDNIDIPNDSTTDGSTTSVIVNSGDETKFVVNSWQMIVDPVDHVRYCKKITAIDSSTHKITFDTSFTIHAGARMGIIPYDMKFGDGAALKGVLRFGYTSDNEGSSVDVIGSVSIVGGFKSHPLALNIGYDYLLQQRYIRADFINPENGSNFSDITYGILSDTVLSATNDSSMNHEDIFGISEKDEGTASSGTSTTLSDSTKTWGTNEHTDRMIIITTGTGAGQVRKIASNTASEVTITSAWNATPDNTSEYKICLEAYRFFKQSNEVAIKIGG